MQHTSAKQVVAYCIADAFDWSALQGYLAKKNNFQKLNSELVTFSTQQEDTADIAVFEYGCVVFWGYDPKQVQQYLGDLGRFVKRKYKQIESEVFTLKEVQDTSIRGNIIQVDAQQQRQHKIAISYALAQAVRLSQYEELVEKTFTDLNDVTKSLTQSGRVRMRTGKVLKKTGQIFYVRAQINLHSDLLDTPDYFWDRHEEELIYLSAYKELDLPKRLHNLNKRLDIMQDLYSMLSEQIKHTHSVVLEVVIIILIGIEVITTWIQWWSSYTAA